MSLITWLTESRSLEKPAVPITDESLMALFAGAQSAAGKAVSADSALRVAAVYACVRIIAETMGTLPLPVYRRLQPRGRERAPEHPLYTLLHDLPNHEMTSIELREAMTGHVCLQGIAYCEIERDNAGRARALWPLRPDRVTPQRVNGRLYFVVDLPDGTRRGLPDHRVWRVRGFGTDPLRGLSVIGQAREAIGLAMAAEEYGARLFSNDSRPGGILKHPGQLKGDAAKRLKASWEAAHSGLSNAHRVAVLEEGVEWQQIGMVPQDAQYLELRKFQITEIARLFRVPPHMLADLDRATFSNIEHQSIEFVMNTMAPWMARFEQSILRDLFTPEERRTWYAEFLVDGLLRGDIQSRYQAYAVGRQNGWLSANDIREKENMNPIAEGGDLYLVPLNMVPADMVADMDAPEPEPTGQRSIETRAGTADVEARARKARRYGLERRRIGQSYRRLVAQASTRVIKRERADVMRQARKMMEQRDAREFLTWLQQFYDDYRAFIGEAYLPVLASLAEQVQANAAEQIGAEAGMTATMDAFVQDYVRVAADRYTRSSFGQLRQILDLAALEDEDPIEALETRFDEWEERRPSKLAMTHTVRCVNAITKETWRQGGIRRLTWAAYGENCPYCEALDGRTVAMEESFLRQDEEFRPNEDTAPLRPHRNIGHAPAHMGCDCQIEPA